MLLNNLFRLSILLVEIILSNGLVSTAIERTYKPNDIVPSVKPIDEVFAVAGGVGGVVSEV